MIFSTVSQFQIAPKKMAQGSRRLAPACLVLILFLQPLFLQPADASVTLDFNTLPGGGLVEHGRIINSQYSSSHGVTISAVNVGGGPDLVVAFDTSKTGTRDPDLEGPFTGGNIDHHTFLGNVLIIQEDREGIADGAVDGVVNHPDDEGSRPAGSIFFDFDNPITEIGFDLLDVEGPSEYGRNSGYVASFFAAGVELARVGFNEFITSTSLFYDSTVKYGNNSANRIQPITAGDLSRFTNTILETFNHVEINFGGSAAIDNLVFTPFTPASQSAVPEVSSVLVWGLLGLTVGSGYRRRKRTFSNFNFANSASSIRGRL